MKDTIFQDRVQHNHPIELISPKWIRQKLHYLHQNPVQAGLVQKAQHYVYSSASNYLDETGILAVTVIDMGISDFYIFTGGTGD